VRSKLFGTPNRPRLSVYRSEKHIYAQLVDDHAGKTLATASSLTPQVRGEVKSGANIAAAKAVGREIAERAKAAGVTMVAFDRGGRMYHGRIKALADAAREGGLKF
jgi:large subunit ribosomal protein L18